MADAKRPMCGLVMPIGLTDGLGPDHWLDVRAILEESLTNAGFDVRMVSESDDAGVIQKSIVQNLYSDELIVCDVSGKNPNVMFELGMRLAFDQPTVVVKDDVTNYNFDLSPIQHLGYPRDLRYSSINAFKAELISKAIGTHEAKGKNSFLKSFGDFKEAIIDIKPAALDEVVLDELRAIRKEVIQLRNRPDNTLSAFRAAPPPVEENLLGAFRTRSLHLDSLTEEQILEMDAYAKSLGLSVSYENSGPSKHMSLAGNDALLTSAVSRYKKIRSRSRQQD
jgi:hypothetical protein